MTLIFELTMPNVGSWNGRWSGEGRLYAIVKNIGESQKAKAKADELLRTGSWYHRWDDGWTAKVTVRSATPVEARRARAKSCGFCGYDWMVDSILQYGDIHTEPPKVLA